MVQEELERRRKKKLFNGKFMTVCHFFGYQGRSAMPSRFDAKLAFAFGHLAVICIESGLTGYCATIRGLCGETQEWKLGTIPFNSMLSFTASQDTTYFSNRSNDKNDVPIIPSADVNLNGKAYHWLRAAAGQWQLQDRFCNPGPLQFHGKFNKFSNLFVCVCLY
jgi:6-phosphofructokinase